MTGLVGFPLRSLRRWPSVFLLLVGPAAQLGAGQEPASHSERGTITLTAVVQAEAFRHSLPPDHQYHLLAHRGGSAAEKALFVTHIADTVVARAMRERGAEDGGGVPMAAWNLRWVPLVPQPTARVQGTPVTIRITWNGAERLFDLEELLEDPGGEGIDMRFGGHEQHDDDRHSGSIICLFSCPGGVISNAAYSIRDHQRAATTFDPGARLPPDGTEVTIVILFGEG